MKINLIFVLLLFAISTLTAQRSFDDYNQSKKDEFDKFVDKQNKKFEHFTARQNAEFADFLEREWLLFNSFGSILSPYTKPKLEEAPLAPCSTNCDWSLDFKEEIEFVIRKMEKLNNKPNSNDIVVSDGSNIDVDFYGEVLHFAISGNLFQKAIGISERNVADYLRSISKFFAESSVLWDSIEAKSAEFGLNDWGKYLMVKSISDKIFERDDDKVLFCFYMLRNMGGYKVKIGRSVDNENLVLLIAIDNSKNVYTFGYYNFNEQGKDVKYYLVKGKSSGGIYSYDLNNQDLILSQMRLDFDKTLSIGKCDCLRELKVNRLNLMIDLPFNSKNIAFLDEVPLTIFPIYFVSAMPEESQYVLNKVFGRLGSTYSPVDAVNILLNFVQTAFDYQSDDDQFGREKYFYPEEVIAYPYSDCEDRSALFGWLVSQYLNMSVIGLKYPGHLATAVYLGQDVEVKGATYFNYAGKRYYVCDPTYIAATIGMEMPQFKDVTPSVVKLKEL